MRIVPQKTISFWLETGKKDALDAIAIALDRDRSQANAGKFASKVKVLAAFERRRSEAPLSRLAIADLDIGDSCRAQVAGSALSPR
jgi:hypothetical protein